MVTGFLRVGGQGDAANRRRREDPRFSHRKHPANERGPRGRASPARVACRALRVRGGGRGVRRASEAEDCRRSVREREQPGAAGRGALHVPRRGLGQRTNGAWRQRHRYVHARDRADHCARWRAIAGMRWCAPRRRRLRRAGLPVPAVARRRGGTRSGIACRRLRHPWMPRVAHAVSHFSRRAVLGARAPRRRRRAEKREPEGEDRRREAAARGAGWHCLEDNGAPDGWPRGPARGKERRRVHGDAARPWPACSTASHSSIAILNRNPRSKSSISTNAKRHHPFGWCRLVQQEPA